MDVNNEELEKRMAIKIEAVRDTMLDRFSGVDQKLTAIEQLLKNIIEPQSQTGNPPENRWKLLDKNTRGGTESTETQDKGYKVAIGRGDSGPSHESGPKKPSQAQISLDGDDKETNCQIRGPPGGLYLNDGGRKGPRLEAGSSGGWVGLYTTHYGTYNPPVPEYSFGKDFCGPAWVGLKKTDFSKKNGPGHEGQLVNSFVKDCPETQRDKGLEGFGLKVVNADVNGRVSKKTGKEDIFRDGENKPKTQVITEGSNGGRSKTRRGKRKAKKADVTGTSLGKKVVKTGQDEKVADKTLAGGEVKKDEKTDVLLQGSSNPDQWTKNSADSWFKALCSNTDFHWRFPDDNWNKLVEAQAASQHGSGALWGKKGDNKPQPPVITDGSDEKAHEERQNPRSWGSKEEGCGFKAIRNETNFDLRYPKSDHCRDWSKLVEAKVASHGSGALWGKKGNTKPQPQVVIEGSNEKGHEESLVLKPGLCGSKEEGCGSKRKHIDSPNDCPISSGLFTRAKQRVDMFTTDEQDSHLNEIEPIMQSIKRIMLRYNDGDPLSAKDQAYILENVFNHHPQKAQKMGAGVDYIMVSKHMKFHGSRCFYVVSTDGRKEDFSYHKCLKNFINEKYPNKGTVVALG